MGRHMANGVLRGRVIPLARRSSRRICVGTAPRLAPVGCAGLLRSRRVVKPRPMSTVADYLAAVRANLAPGQATEHTHRPALQALLESVGGDITATYDPRRIACGSPDFQISRKRVPLGHVETKDIGARLDEMERGKGPHGEQFQRYRDALSNWILTDYLEFRWYVNGERRLTARLADVDAQGELRVTPFGEANFTQLLQAFFGQAALTIGTARDLAQRMAAMTRIVRDL